MIRSLGALVLLLPAVACGGSVPPLPAPTAVTAAAAPKESCTYQDPKAATAARAKLNRDLARYLARRPGRVSAMAKDLATGATVGYHEHSHQQITASGVKA